MNGSLYELALSVPWQITNEALEAMLAIAAREELDEGDLARRFHGPKALALRNGQRRDDGGRMVMRDGGVATIPIDGPIYRYADYFTQVSGGVTTEQLGRDFGRAMDDPAVSAVLFVIDSPGGEATGIGELSDAIYAARGRKPIGAYIEGYGASAAYHIASAADLVMVDDDALVGSIGTILGVPDPAKIQRRTIDFVSSQSPKKRADPTTAEGRQYLQQLVDDMTEVFIEKVARNRGLSRDAILTVQGGLLVGKQAISAGLADRLGSEEGAIRELAAIASTRRELRGMPRLQEESMKVFSQEWWANLFGGAAQAEAAPPAAAVEGGQVTSGQLQAAAVPLRLYANTAIQGETLEAQDDPRVAELQEQLAKMQREQREQQATQFVDGLIAQHRALPAQRAELIRLYAAAAEDDARSPLENGSRVATLKAVLEAKPAHELTKELVPNSQLVALTGTAETGSTADQLATGRAQGKAYAEKANRKTRG